MKIRLKISDSSALNHNILRPNLLSLIFPQKPHIVRLGAASNRPASTV
jgi:hypothetical protein